MSQPQAPVLVILAAGLGRRFGGLKQLAPVGPGGEALLDYSARDALAAGFVRVILVVRPEIEAEVRAHVAGHWPPTTAVGFACQDPDPVTGKPRGTAEAVLVARGEVGPGSFAVVNADDYYGPGSLRLLADHLGAPGADHALVGFRLGDTAAASEGSLRRALCQAASDGTLLSIDEREIRPLEDADPAPESAASPGSARRWYRSAPLGGEQWSPVSGDALVSMNAWGFRPSVWRRLDAQVRAFLRRDGAAPVAGAEVLLPDVARRLLADGDIIRVLPAVDRWLGLTWSGDLDSVRAALASAEGGGAAPVAD